MEVNISKDITNLLIKLKNKNESNNFDGLLIQTILPTKTIEGIPTLKKELYRDSSPMIKARFDFASTWKNAGINQNWLSVQEMENVWENKIIWNQINTRKKYWENSVLNKYSIEEITLFGIDTEEQEETYLVWKDLEPSIFFYSNQNEYIFQNFKEFLIFLIET